MQLTRHTDYSLRVLMYLAAKPNQLITVAELANFYAISRNHLVKVVQGLVEHGFIKTVRGKYGGMQLAKNSDDISIGNVVRHMENHFNIVECMGSEQQHCALNGICSLKNMLARATEDYLKNLDKVSLTSVNKPQLRKLIVEFKPL